MKWEWVAAVNWDDLGKHIDNMLLAKGVGELNDAGKQVQNNE